MQLGWVPPVLIVALHQISLLLEVALRQIPPVLIVALHKISLLLEVALRTRSLNCWK